jgi:hypothetical protein
MIWDSQTIDGFKKTNNQTLLPLNKKTPTNKQYRPGRNRTYDQADSSMIPIGLYISLNLILAVNLAEGSFTLAGLRFYTWASDQVNDRDNPVES